MSAKSFFHFSFTSILLLVAILANLVYAQNLHPKTEKREVKDIYFGNTITDNFRWLEDLKSEEVQTWMKAQADYSRLFLDRLPSRASFLKEIEKLDDSGISIYGVQKVGNQYCYFRLQPGEDDASIYLRDGLNGKERLLVAPDKIANDGKRRSINSFRVSQDGKFLSYLSSTGGGEIGEIRVVETKTERHTGDLIERIRYGSGSWLPDGRSFAYSHKIPLNDQTTERYQKRRIYLHVLGTSPDADKPIFGYEVNPNIKLTSGLNGDEYIPGGSKYIFAIANTGVSPNSEVYFSTIESLYKYSGSEIPWKKIISLDDEVADFRVNGEDLYLLTYKNTPRYKITRINLKEFGKTSPEFIFSGGEAVIESMAPAKDALYVKTLDGGINKIYRIDYKTKKAEPVNLPFQGSAAIVHSSLLKDGIDLNLTSWTHSPARFSYNPKTKKATDTKLIPKIDVDMSRYDFVYKKAKSHDGVMVPFVVIYKKGLKLDGKNLVYLHGYGAYGNENISPYFGYGLKPWLERGGVYVFTGVRGGGEYGEEWHFAGKGKTKPNTWKDFIACAEYLIEHKYTSPKKIGIVGGSAGGILMSNALAERPDLFGAAIISNGVNNPLLFELTPTGIANTAEFDTFKTEEGFKNLLAMDGYYKIKDGIKYPAVMLTHGINDPRVFPWMSSKMAARLQAATTSEKPVLLRLDYDAGHGIGSGQKQFNELQADIYGFLFEQLNQAN